MRPVRERAHMLFTPSSSSFAVLSALWCIVCVVVWLYTQKPYQNQQMPTTPQRRKRNGSRYTHTDISSTRNANTRIVLAISNTYRFLLDYLPNNSIASRHKASCVNGIVLSCTNTNTSWDDDGSGTGPWACVFDVHNFSLCMCCSVAPCDGMVRCPGVQPIDKVNQQREQFMSYDALTWY